MPLAASVNCPKCGAANLPGVSFCANCGSPLAMGAGGPATPPPMAYGAPGYPGYPGYPGASPFDVERKKQVDRTKTGVLLLLVGTLIGWIPLVGVIGLILIFIGVIFVIIGRKAFGATHSRNVILSIVLFFIGIGISAAGGIVLAGIFFAGFAGAPTQAAVQSALTTYLIIGIVGSIISGLASILFIFALQNQTGRLLLFAAYGASIAIQIATFVLLSGTFAQILSSAFPGGTYNATAAAAALANFTSQASSLALLSVIPALLFAAADYIVWSRINRGEIPASAMPGAPPPMPGP